MKIDLPLNLANAKHDGIAVILQATITDRCWVPRVLSFPRAERADASPAPR